MEFDEKFIEDIGNVVFKAATFTYRDTKLSENMIVNYSQPWDEYYGEGLC